MESQLYRDFARLEDGHWWFRGRQAVIRAVLRQRLPRAQRRILDVGCGTGGMLKMLAKLGPVEGLDAYPEALAYCRDRVGPGIELHLGGLPQGLPPGRRYSLVTAFDVLEHLDDPVAALWGIRKALDPDGALLCTVPAYGLLWSDHDLVNQHRRRYSKGLLREHLEEAGFTPGYFSYFNSSLLPPIALVRLGQQLLPSRSGGEPHSDFDQPAAWVNTLLEALFSAERHLVPRLPMPFGVSLLAIARPT